MRINNGCRKGARERILKRCNSRMQGVDTLTSKIEHAQAGLVEVEGAKCLKDSSEELPVL